ncbi:hypothetical protein BD310DRAFT_964171 [Dichomitus squalens]|uniref:Uncharacterized protein n=1 Tax=Dichomitus squalens TaxID=114155 RepID=A0A4Q9Q9Q2_9APHY|nr:hypothetical protein BD310DRAFT_964171 [Dichomitus squalens]
MSSEHASRPQSAIHEPPADVLADVDPGALPTPQEFVMHVTLKDFLRNFTIDELIQFLESLSKESSEPTDVEIEFEMAVWAYTCERYYDHVKQVVARSLATQAAARNSESGTAGTGDSEVLATADTSPSPSESLQSDVDENSSQPYKTQDLKTGDPSRMPAN